MAKCILWGGYGGGNVGDELTLAIGIMDMQAKFGSDIAILSSTEEYTRWLFPQVDVIPCKQHENKVTKSLRFIGTHLPGIKKPLQKHIQRKMVHTALKLNEPWQEQLAQANYLYLVGGGYVNDLFNFERMILPIKLARAQGLHITTAPIAVGPFENKNNLSEFARTFSSVTLQVRDRESLLLCQKLGLEAFQSLDDGFRIAELLDNDTIRQSRLSIPTIKQKIGLCFYHQKGAALEKDQYFDWWLRALSAMKAKGWGDRLEGFCFHSKPQLDFNDLVNLFMQSGLPLRQINPPDFYFLDAIRRLQGFQSVITSRFHAGVTAQALGIPFTAVSSGEFYNHKMASIPLSNVSGHVVMESTDPEVFVEELSQRLVSL